MTSNLKWQAAAAGMVLALAPVTVCAQGYPSKQLRVVDRLNAGIHKALADKDLRERLTVREADPAPGTP